MSGREHHILVVDDNPVNTSVLQRYLARQGFVVSVSDSGLQARRMIAEAVPDLILLDIMMPGEDGFAVIRSLKSQSETASIPVIFLTGVDDVDSKIAGFELGAVDYITKPFNLKEVQARVSLHLKLSAATRSMVAAQTARLHQIEVAQKSLHVEPRALPEAGFAVYYRSLYEAGGDIYDVIKITDDIYGFFVGDISGHDLGVGFMASAVHALLSQNCVPIYEPRETMQIINDVLVNVLPSSKYLTANYIRLNRRSNMLNLICAAHPPVLYQPLAGEPRLLEASGDVLGMFRGAVFGELEMAVAPGDRFFIFSDGLLECRGLVWPAVIDELPGVLLQHSGLALAETVAAVANSLTVDRLTDDVVLLGFEV